MTSWGEVREVVEAALALEPSERDAFVAERCGQDEALRREVLALLAQDGAPDPYLDTPPDPHELKLVADRTESTSCAHPMVAMRRTPACLARSRTASSSS